MTLIDAVSIYVESRLKSIGYELADGDNWLIQFCTQKVENTILNDINQREVPRGLYECAIDMICGEFLKIKYDTGKLDIEGLDLSGAVSAISEGDTSVSFDSSASDASKFSLLVEYLLNSKKGDMACYRKIKW